MVQFLVIARSLGRKEMQQVSDTQAMGPAAARAPDRVWETPLLGNFARFAPVRPSLPPVHERPNSDLGAVFIKVSDRPVRVRPSVKRSSAGALPFRSRCKIL